VTLIDDFQYQHNTWCHVDIPVPDCPWCEIDKLKRMIVHPDDLQRLVECFSARRDEDEAARDRVKLILNGNPSVSLSLEDYDAGQETAHLMGTPANATRLLQSIKQIEGAAAKYTVDFKEIPRSEASSE